MRPEKYSYITRGGKLDEALQGIDAAVNAGFRVKINTVLIKGFNDDEISDFAAVTLRHDIDVRFIELMPMTESFRGFLAAGRILDSLPNIEPLKLEGVAKMYKLKNALGRIGIITTISDTFCASCNRIRLTTGISSPACIRIQKYSYAIRQSTKSNS